VASKRHARHCERLGSKKMSPEPKNFYTSLIQKIKSSTDPTDLLEVADRHVDTFAAEVEYYAERGETTYTYRLFRDALSNDSYTRFLEQFRRGLIRLGFPPDNIVMTNETNATLFTLACTLED
jgi:hypothetical protein